MTCGGHAYPATITYEETVNGHHNIVTGVPAHICEKCGDELLEFQTVKRLEKLLKDEQPVRMMEAPVYEFSTPA